MDSIPVLAIAGNVAEGHFIVVATALAKSGMKGKIIYESKTGKWVRTEDIRQEWLP